MAYARRRRYIPGSFQRAFVLKFCGVVVVGCVLFAAALYAYSSQAVTTAFVDSRLRVLRMTDYLWPMLAWATTIVGLLSAATCGLLVMLLSHRIAGPLYRLERVARSVGQGDLAQHVRLRERDELKQMAGAMDEMVQELRTRITSVKRQAHALEARVQAMDRVVDSSTQDLPKLREDVQQLHRLLEQFRA